MHVLSDSELEKEHTYAEICRPKRPATPPTPVYDSPRMERSSPDHCQPLVNSDAVPVAQEYLDFVPSAPSTLTGHAESLASKLQAIITPPGVAEPESCLESEKTRLPNGGSKRIDIYNLELGEQKNHKIETGKPEREDKNAYQLLEEAQIPGLEPRRPPAGSSGGGKTEDWDTIDEPLAIDAGPIPGPPLPTVAATNAVTQTACTPNEVSYEIPPDCANGRRGPVYHSLEGGKAPVHHNREQEGKAPVYHTLDGKAGPVYHTLEGGKASVTLEGGGTPVYHTLEGGVATDKPKIHPGNGDAKMQHTTGTNRKRVAYTPIDTSQQTEDHEYTVPIKSSPERYLSEKGHMYHVIRTPQNT